MKYTLIFIIGLFIGGCVFIVQDDSKIKYYGVKQQDAEHLMQLITDKQQQNAGINNKDKRLDSAVK